MRFYTKQHKAYCGIDLHARSLYVCILNQDGESMLHHNMKTSPETFLKAIAPYREDLVVAVECLFTWYWLADLCAQEQIPFVLGHALYMKAIEFIRIKPSVAMESGAPGSCGGRSRVPSRDHGRPPSTGGCGL